MSKVTTTIIISSHIDPMTSLDIMAVANKDCEEKLRGIMGEDFIVLDYEVSYEFLCRTTIIKKRDGTTG